MKIVRPHHFAQLDALFPSLPASVQTHGVPVTYRKRRAYTPPPSLTSMLEDAFLRNDWRPTARLMGTLHASSLDFTNC